MGGEATIEVPDEEKKVFVGGLPHDCKHEDVKEHFTRFGGVEKVKLMSDQATGRFKGFGFVVFEEVSGFAAALAEPDQTFKGGRSIQIKRATVKVRQGKIYVGKLPSEGCTEDDIRTHFEQFGTVVEVIRPVDKAKNDEPKNFAFVTFQREEISRKLVKLGEDVMCGTKIVIKPVITKDPAMGQGAHHHQMGGPPIGGPGLMGGAPMPRPPAPGAWAPPNAYSGYGAQHHQQVDPDFWHGFRNGLAKSYGGYGQQGSYGGAPAPHTGYHQQGQGSYGGMGGGHHPPSSSSYYGNHTGGYTHAAQGPAPPASESPAYHPNGVPSLATFNPYDMASYGGGKVRSSAPLPPRPTPY